MYLQSLDGPGDTGGGWVRQTKSAIKTDTQSFNGNVSSASFAAIGGLSIAITPATTTSKFLLTTNITMGGQTSWEGWIRFYEGNSAITLAYSSASGSRSRVTSACHYDGNTSDPQHIGASYLVPTAGNTTARTFNVYMGAWNNTANYVNRPYGVNSQEGWCSVCSFDVMEIQP